MPRSEPPQPKGLLVLRHAQSTWNAAGRWQGWADPPLSPLGESQIHTAAKALRQAGFYGFGAAFSSDLQRARQTAQGLCAELEGPEPFARADLREHDVGEWSGLTRDQIEERWPGQLARWSRGQLPSTPGGEERPAFEARIVGAVTDIARSHAGQRVLVVCHGGAIRALTRVIAREQSQVGSLGGCRVSFDGDRLHLVGPVDPLGQNGPGAFPSVEPPAE